MIIIRLLFGGFIHSSPGLVIGLSKSIIHLVNFNDTDASFCPTEFCLVKYSIRDKTGSIQAI